MRKKPVRASTFSTLSVGLKAEAESLAEEQDALTLDEGTHKAQLEALDREIEADTAYAHEQEGILKRQFSKLEK